jgi:membrane-associated phospholipid phosphatase
MSEESLSTSVERTTPRGLMAAIARNAAFQDYFTFTFHTYMLIRAHLAPDGEHTVIARPFAITLWTVTLAAILLGRGEILGPGKVRAGFYRVALFTPMVLSYFELRHLLPSLRPVLLDPELHAIDRMLFGVTPSVFMAQWNTQPVVEWISFFYYSYFAMMALILIPSLFFDDGDRLQELLTGAMLVCGLGHIGYTLVPGMGPWVTIPFDEPLHGGFWWHQVKVTVDAAGSQLDIFPSLHTAYPAFFTLHAYGNRHRLPWKFVWPVIGFFAINMITATMFLRWHWGIDVIAGLCVATTARLVAMKLAQIEKDRDADGERQAVWEKLVR